ncbi:MAG: class I SAM-dependent methyltransferase [Phycisphaerae bacterium]|nr:class I SAM-dependent methyltransferase [Phycisphaerae bacterium]
MAGKPQHLCTDPDELRRIGVLPVTFAAAYAAGTAAWEIGSPQPIILELAERGAFIGRVLDIGCGTGENALELARRGVDITAIDCVEQAINEARAKARERGLRVDFQIGDALRLDRLNSTFDTILDSATYHVFSDADRLAYVRGVASRLRFGGMLHLIVFSEAETRPGGPRRVSRAELEAAFGAGWRIRAVEPTRYMVRMFDDGARAWAATIERV